MGRKPHTLIQQYFERGTKLNDNSNRYEQRCRACGDHFPKGRLDSLQNHIIKKCKMLSIEARQNAALLLNNLPVLEGGNDVTLSGSTLTLPLAAPRNWTPLETLAEVSRLTDINEKHHDRSVHNKSAGGGGRPSEPTRSDRLELQEQFTLDNPPVSYDRAQREKKMLGAKAQRRESEGSLQHPNFGHRMAESRSESPNLAMAAVAASRFQPLMVDPMVDPQLLGEDVNTQNNFASTPKAMKQALGEAEAGFGETFHHHNHAEHQLTWPMVDGSGTHVFSEPTNLETSSSMNDAPGVGSYSRNTLNGGGVLTTEFSAEYGNGQKTKKHKIRGRFNETRRKEVQNVRKLGACIRCRMLKKPCSQGDPCSTCAGVESARLWKTPCIRTRLGEMFEMYSAKVHYVLALHSINKTKSQTKFNPSPYQIEATHFVDSGIYATFDSLEGEVVSVQTNIDPGLSGDFRANTLRMLDTESGEKLPAILDNYMKRMSSTFFKNEPSLFMRTTLVTAERLVTETDDKLLRTALDLWALTHILIDHEMTWVISQRVNIDAPEGQGPGIDRSNDHATYTLLSLQLNSATEQKAAVLCKNILGDLERFLLQRTQGDTFKTFLTAIITLSCVEKSTWLFKSWEQDSFKSLWPLDKKPSAFAGQGEQLTQMLEMLTRLRHIPPKTYARHDGILAATDDSSADFKAYFEQLQLRYENVLSKQANHTFDPANSRCYELRFCSRLLLPNP